MIGMRPIIEVDPLLFSIYIRVEIELKRLDATFDSRKLWANVIEKFENRTVTKNVIVWDNQPLPRASIMGLICRVKKGE